MTVNYMKRLNRILKEKGSNIAELAGKTILMNIESKELQEPLQYLVEHREDMLRPTLISLACEAVGGDPTKAQWTSVAMVLDCYAINILDDVIDKSTVKSFYPTFYGRFGVEMALFVIGLLTSKASYSLSKMAGEISNDRYVKVNEVFHSFLTRMAEAEVENARLKRARTIDSAEHYSVLEKQAVDTEACMVIGATIGEGNEWEVEQLGTYGKLLGTIIRLREDLDIALNLSVELAHKIRSYSFPYPLVCAMSHSQRARDFVYGLTKKEKIGAVDVERCVGLLFDTGVSKDLEKLVSDLAGKAVSNLAKLKGKEPVRCLETIALAQEPLLFRQLKP